MDWIPLIISLISGAFGGNIAGALMKEKSLGTAGNSIAGILGGGAVGAILKAVGFGGAAAAATPGATAGGLDLVAILGNIVGGGVGGGVLMAIISAIKTAMAKK